MLTLWKRHSAACQKTNQKAFQKLAPKQHRFFKNCQCACWVAGTHPITKERIRRSLRTSSWDSGVLLKAQLELSRYAEIREPEIARKKAIQDAARCANIKRESEAHRQKIEALYPYLSARKKEKMHLAWYANNMGNFDSLGNLTKKEKETRTCR